MYDEQIECEDYEKWEEDPSFHQNPTTTRPTTDDDTIHQISGPQFPKH